MLKRLLPAATGRWRSGTLANRDARSGRACGVAERLESAGRLQRLFTLDKKAKRRERADLHEVVLRKTLLNEGQRIDGRLCLID